MSRRTCLCSFPNAAATSRLFATALPSTALRTGKDGVADGAEGWE